MGNFHKANLIGRNADVWGFNLLLVFHLSWLGGSESSVRVGEKRWDNFGIFIEEREGIIEYLDYLETYPLGNIHTYLITRPPPSTFYLINKLKKHPPLPSSPPKNIR